MLKEIIEKNMERGNLSGQVLFNRVYLPDEEIRRASFFRDPKFLSFYYYLGQLITPKSLLEFGFDLGLTTSCFFKSCKTVEKYLAFKEKTDKYYSSRLGKKNIKWNFKGDFCIYVGSTEDERFSNLLNSLYFDLVFINGDFSYDKCRFYFDLAWERLTSGGIIVIDFINRCKHSKRAYFDFCRVKNREFILIETKYGVGIIKK